MLCGGTNNEDGLDISVDDASGTVYIAGRTASNSSFAGISNTDGHQVAILLSLNAGDGATSAVSTYSPATGTSYGYSLDVDRSSTSTSSGGSSSIYQTGHTTGERNGLALTGSQDAFVIKTEVLLSAAASAAPTPTLLVGDVVAATSGLATAVLCNGDYVLGGSTSGVVGSARVGSMDLFLRKGSPAGEVPWTKQFGGGIVSALSYSAAITVDDSDNIYVVGECQGMVNGMGGAGSSDSCFSLFSTPADSRYMRVSSGARVWIRSRR